MSIIMIILAYRQGGGGELMHEQQYASSMTDVIEGRDGRGLRLEVNREHFG